MLTDWQDAHFFAHFHAHRYILPYISIRRHGSRIQARDATFW